MSIRSVHGAVRLAFDSVEGITNTVERMHQTIAGFPLPLSRRSYEPTQSHGMIAASVYSIIRGVNGMMRDGVDITLGTLPQTAGGTTAAIKTTAALNGAFGDHLEATGNPLATSMSLMTSDEKLELDSDALAAPLQQVSPHLVVLVHGLGLSELSWRRGEAPGLDNRLQAETDCTILYLRYNSGRHVSTNGREFAQKLKRLCALWPVPVKSLSLIGHSMGGLIIRSACCYAEQNEEDWLEPLQRIAFLGTPHHGAPLEKAGHAIDVLLQRSPYTAPLALGRHRSAGIKDLRYGNLLDEDWEEDANLPQPDTRIAVPLSAGVDYYFVAASVGQHDRDPLGHLLGDLLVRRDSAIGAHEEAHKELPIVADHCRVFHEKHHFDLLYDPQVHQQLLDWFGAKAA